MNSCETVNSFCKYINAFPIKALTIRSIWTNNSVLTAILGCLVLLGSAMDMSIRATKGRREKVPLTPGLDAVQLSKISTHFQSKENEVIETSLSNRNTEGLIGNLQGNGHVENGGIDNPAGPTLPATNGGHFAHSNGGQPPRSEEKKLNQKPKCTLNTILFPHIHSHHR